MTTPNIDITIAQGEEVDTPRSDLDLRNNDNSFHVLANVLVNFFEAKRCDVESAVVLKLEDRAPLERILPASVRPAFIDAVQYRADRCPLVPGTSLQVLTRQCRQLCFDKDVENPILVCARLKESEPVFVQVLPRLDVDRPEAALLANSFEMTQRSKDPRVQGDQGGRPSSSEVVHDETAKGEAENETTVESVKNATEGAHIPVVETVPSEPQLIAPFVPENPVIEPVTPAAQQVPNLVDTRSSQDPPSEVQQELTKQLSADVELLSKLEDEKTRMSNTVAQSLDIPNEFDPKTDDSIARKQLLAELREANRLVEASVTPETAQFWRNHVNDLQARLRSLDNGGITAPPQRVSAQKQPQYQSRDYDPPTIDGRHASGNRLPDASDQNVDYDSPMVDVVAPADLPGGYQFEAEIEGQRFLATVPAGGVQEGETFTCYMRELDSVAVDIPVGNWKDGAQDICKYGCCHALFWGSLCFPLSKYLLLVSRFCTVIIQNSPLSLTLSLSRLGPNPGKNSFGLHRKTQDNACYFLPIFNDACRNIVLGHNELLPLHRV